MPVLTIMAHLTLIHSNYLATVVTVLGKHGIKTAEAVGLALAHYLALTAQLMIALKAGKMLHVPGSSLRFGAFIGEDYLKEKKRNI